MQELTARQVHIDDPFWSPRLAINAETAIFHQWEQLEATGCIDNFRMAVGEKEGFREGYFFADSDAYKWLDAASRIHALHPQPELAALMDSFIALLSRTQMSDGYIFTYNQIHFPGQRWVNLQVEHELYCHGHLIEAGVSHFEATGRRELLDVCIKAADLLVLDFLHASPDKTCGHEEIEIALIRLYRVTGKSEYVELARQFVERRGRIPFFPLHLWRQFSSYKKREKFVNAKRKAYIAEHPERTEFRLPGGNQAKKPRFSRQRWYLNALSGRYAQQHTPIRRQTAPEGHSVRFGYLETAIAMLLRTGLDENLLSTLSQAWERMVTRRMYITGGLGSVPGLEGFGGDYELDPEYAYAETCASIASLLWNWEMTLLTRDARYSDLFEWQLYNAASVGMGRNGNTYLYNNPLEVRDGVTRKAWYSVPCCPSNLSRTFADLGKHICSFDENNLWIHQYLGSEMSVDVGEPVGLKIESGLPWSGRVLVRIDSAPDRVLGVYLRVPSWDPFATLFLHEPIDRQLKQKSGIVKSPGVNGVTQYFSEKTASSYDPRWSSYTFIEKQWSPGDVLEFNFDMSIKVRAAHARVKGHAGKGAVTRGPLVYCLESTDNPDVDIFAMQVDPASLRDEFDSDLLGGCVVVHGETVEGKPLRFIPYFLWANRGESQMTVWVNT